MSKGHNSLILYVPLWLYLLVLFPSPAISTLELLVPAYANPCCGGGPNMWSSLTQPSDSDGQIIHIILNPASGPGNDPTGIDLNYVATDGMTGPLVDVVAQNPNAKLYGYVATGYGTRPVASIQADMDRYYAADYFRGATIPLAGIFFDEMSSTVTDIPFYQSLRSYLHTQHDPSAIVMANPGVLVAEDFFAASPLVADTIITFEQTAVVYMAEYEEPDWTPSYAASRFGHLIHTTTMGADQMRSMVALAQNRHVGFLYVTDDPYVVLETDNPWDTLPSFWGELEEAVAMNDAIDGKSCVWDWLLDILWSGVFSLMGGLLDGWMDVLESLLCGR